MFSLSKQLRYLNSMLLWISNVSLSLSCSLSLSLCQYLTRAVFFGNPPAVFLCVSSQHGRNKNFSFHPLLLIGARGMLDIVLILDFASQRCSLEKSANTLAVPLCQSPVEPASSAICTVTHLTVISRHL